MGTVRRVCAILLDWHSATFQNNAEIELEAVIVEKYCKGGSEHCMIRVAKEERVNLSPMDLI